MTDTTKTLRNPSAALYIERLAERGLCRIIPAIVLTVDEAAELRAAFPGKRSHGTDWAAIARTALAQTKRKARRVGAK